MDNIDEYSSDVGQESRRGGLLLGRGQRRKWKQSFKIFSIHKNGRGLIHQSISGSDCTANTFLPASKDNCSVGRDLIIQ